MQSIGVKSVLRKGSMWLAVGVATAVGGTLLFLVACIIFDLKPFDVRDDAFVAWARQHAIAMPPLQSNDTLAPVRPLVDRFGDARVIGIGESTFGTHEFERIRSDIVQVMANRGLTDVIFDDGFASMRAIDAWVQGGDGDIRQLLFAHHLWANTTRDNVALLAWLREWNTQPGRLRPIHVRGMGGGSLSESLTCVAEYAQRSGMAVAVPDSASLPLVASEPQVTRETVPFYVSPNRSAVPRLMTGTSASGFPALDKMTSQLEAERAQRAIAPTQPEFSLARHCAEMARGRYDMLINRGGRYAQSNADSLMANEVMWWLGQSGAKSRAIILSENDHVGRERSVAPSHAGALLRSMLGNDYIAIGLFFGGGELSVVRGDTSSVPKQATAQMLLRMPLDWLERTLARVSPAPYALDLRDVPRFSAAGWYLSSARTSRQTDMLYNGTFLPRRVPPRQAYDLLVYVPTSSPADMILERAADPAK